MSLIKATLLLLAGLFAAPVAFSSSAHADSPDNLSLDVATVRKGAKSAVLAKPERQAKHLTVGEEEELVVAGSLSNAHGDWYEIIYPVKGWLKKADAVFSGPAGTFAPESLPAEERILLRLAADIGLGSEDWAETLGAPWAEDSWTDTSSGRPRELSTAAWPGAVLVTEAGSLPHDTRIVQATLCGKVPASFGPYALGADGAVLKGLDAGFVPGPFAQFHKGKLQAQLDEDARISFLAYSDDGTNFLSCPAIGTPEPEEPFFAASLYPEAMCRADGLKGETEIVGTYGGFECESDQCAAEIRNVSGDPIYVRCNEEEASRAFGTKEGVRVRATCMVGLDWDEEKGCSRTLQLVSGAIVAADGETDAREECRRKIVASGEARGIVTRGGEGPMAEWEILLDSEKPFSFRAGRVFPGVEEPVFGERVAFSWERVLEWDASENACVPRTMATGPARIMQSVH